MVDDGCCPVMRLIPPYLDEDWGREVGGLSRGKIKVVIIICLLLDNRMLQVVKLTVPSMQHRYCLLLGDDSPPGAALMFRFCCVESHTKKSNLKPCYRNFFISQHPPYVPCSIQSSIVH